VDEYVFALILKERQFYESDVLRLLERLGPREGLAVDAGAHIGNHTVFFAKVLGLKTIAIEPRPESVAVLERNLEANGLGDSVTVIQTVLAAEAGRANLVQKVAGNTGTVMATPAGDGSMMMSRLDDIVESRVSLLKIDVEGDEPAVLDGARGILGEFRPVVCVEAHTGAALDEIFGILMPFDYRPIAIEGRSDNYVFASGSTAAPVPFESARTRSSLYVDRRRDQVVRTAVRDLSSQVRSLGLQFGKLDGIQERLDATEQTLARLMDDLGVLSGRIDDLTSRVASLVESLKGDLTEKDRRLARWQYEYRRATRSRGLRLIQRVRALFARVGLVEGISVLSPEEIEASWDGAD
ncbi:MAG: FkbM family methyltransferase, partial [Serratia inhibens]|uniref:FkbM family methyltransferase n=1 Tax=Serratia inhibens TaxID=2338073 RepID=UPI003C7A3572